MQVLFDIDGTLIDSRTSEGDTYARAVREVLGLEGLATDWSRYAVVTDAGILDQVVREQLGRPVTAAELAAVRERHLVGLERCAEAGEFREVPGAREALGAAAARWPTAIATGNFSAAAWLKLEAAGIPWDGPLSGADDAVSRETILERVMRPGLPSVSVGDGVWDVLAAQRLGIGFVGIAPTPRHRERLLAAGAEHLLTDYLDLEGCLGLLEQVARG